MSDTQIRTDGGSDVRPPEKSKVGRRALWLAATALLGGMFRYPVLVSIELFQPENRNPVPGAAGEALFLGLLSSSVVVVAAVTAFLLLQVFAFRAVRRSTQPYAFWLAAAAAFCLGVLLVGRPMWGV